MSDRSNSGHVPRRSEFWYRRFSEYVLGYVRKHVHAVRIARSAPMPAIPDGPLIVVVNHPSGWDPLIGVVVTSRIHGRRHYAPIESKGLARYPFLGRLGFFGVEPGTGSGARAFLRQASAILDDPNAIVWITAQGEFTDPRSRPVKFKSGIGHVVHRSRRVTLWTMAFEYPFWEERTFEALIAFGSPIEVEQGSSLSPEAWTARLERELGAIQDRLAEAAIRRDPSKFETILGGKAGVGGIYDLWRRFKAMLTGKRFIADHGTDDSLTKSS